MSAHSQVFQQRVCIWELIEVKSNLDYLKYFLIVYSTKIYYYGKCHSVICYTLADKPKTVKFGLSVYSSLKEKSMFMELIELIEWLYQIKELFFLFTVQHGKIYTLI